MDSKIPDPTDLIALVLMVLASLRRLDIKLAEAPDYPHLPPQIFEAWKQAALKAYALVLHAGILKIVLNNLWFYAFRSLVPPIWFVRGGLVIFSAWLLALIVAWVKSRNARIRQVQLGIVLRGRRDRKD